MSVLEIEKYNTKELREYLQSLDKEMLIELCIEKINDLSKALKKQEKETIKKQDQETINEWFAKLWEIYPKHEGKQLALKTFTNKLKSEKTIELKYEKAKKIAIVVQKNIKLWKDQFREKQYIPMLSTLLNREIPN